MQEIWMHVFRNRQALDLAQAETFSGWLAVMVQRRCIDLLQQRAEPLHSALDSEVSDGAELWMSSAADQDQNLEAAELLAAVQLLRSKLKPTWRAFFELYFIEGLDFECAPIVAK